MYLSDWDCYRDFFNNCHPIVTEVFFLEVVHWMINISLRKLASLIEAETFIHPFIPPFTFKDLILSNAVCSIIFIVEMDWTVTY